MLYVPSWKNVGGPNTPQDIQRLRSDNIDALRELGETVVHKHVFTLDDLAAGKYLYQLNDRTKLIIPVERCRACYDSVYGASRENCQVCFGTTVTSADDDPNAFYNTKGQVIIGTGSALPLAPKYRGYGPSTLTYTVQPDVAEDFFKISEEGVFTQVRMADTFAPWTPEMRDNDLMIAVDLAQNGRDILSTHDRYQLKQTLPSTVRGFGANHQRTRYRVGFTFQMVEMPSNSLLQQVPVSGDSNFSEPVAPVDGGSPSTTYSALIDGGSA